MIICILGQKRPPPPAAAGGRRMLATVTVLGSAGPIRFVASEEEPVAAVIGTTLRCYARQGRFPALGCDVGEFHLFCAQSDYTEPLDPSEPIGARGGRNFLLCKKPMQQATLAAPAGMVRGTVGATARRQTRRNEGLGAGMIGWGVWKALFNKSVSTGRWHHPTITAACVPRLTRPFGLTIPFRSQYYYVHA